MLQDKGNKLKNADARIIALVKAAGERYNIYVICTHRSKQEQNKAFSTGASKLKWPKSKHNTLPSTAVDLAPYNPESGAILWNDLEAFYVMAKIVLEEAAKLDIKIRWGGDWNANGSTRDEIFVDRPHFELIL